MHILVSFLFALAGLCWALQALYNSGFFDFINPVKAHRRISWRNKNSKSPLFSITNPMEVAAVLVIGIAKMDGDITREHKEFITGLFVDTFQITKREAAELFRSSEFLLRDYHDLNGCISKVMRCTKDQFDRDRVESLQELMQKSASFENEVTSDQQDFAEAVRCYLR